MHEHEHGRHDPRAVHGPGPGEVPNNLTALIDWECRRCGRRWRDMVLFVVLRMALTRCEPRAERPSPREPGTSQSRRAVPPRFIPDGEVTIGEPDHVTEE